MSEPFLERLSRFTPDAGGLNRDELLYAAGANSARPGRGWMALASGLAVTQALSLVLLLPPPRPLPSGLHTAAAPAPPVAAPGRETAPAATEHPDFRPVRRNLAELERAKRPDGDLALIDSGPPLPAFALGGRSLVD